MTSLKITEHHRCDILIEFPNNGNNNVEMFGFDKNKTLGEMIYIALLHKCPIIIKAGKNAKWYLKGRGKTLEFLKNKIELNKGTKREEMTCYPLEGMPL
jgi:hypothetical protein